jgi:lipase
MAAHARDVLAVIDARGAQRAILVGRSMGGFVVCGTAVRHPERMVSLAIVDGGALDVPRVVPSMRF